MLYSDASSPFYHSKQWLNRGGPAPLNSGQKRLLANCCFSLTLLRGHSDTSVFVWYFCNIGCSARVTSFVGTFIMLGLGSTKYMTEDGSTYYKY